MIFHENRLLADDYRDIIPYFCRKLGKMSQNLSSAAVVIGALRVKWFLPQVLVVALYLTCKSRYVWPLGGQFAQALHSQPLSWQGVLDGWIHPWLH